MQCIYLISSLIISLLIFYSLFIFIFDHILFALEWSYAYDYYYKYYHSSHLKYIFILYYFMLSQKSWIKHTVLSKLSKTSSNKFKLDKRIKRRKKCFFEHLAAKMLCYRSNKILMFTNECASHVHVMLRHVWRRFWTSLVKKIPT